MSINNGFDDWKDQTEILPKIYVNGGIYCRRSRSIIKNLIQWKLNKMRSLNECDENLLWWTIVYFGFTFVPSGLYPRHSLMQMSCHKIYCHSLLSSYAQAIRPKPTSKEQICKMLKKKFSLKASDLQNSI